MHSLGRQAHELLTWAGVSMQPGLTAIEFSAIEARFGVTFNPSHREFLSLGVPVGPGWPEWRSGAESPMRAWVDWPIDGILWDVHNNSFWPRSWGRRPPTAAGREKRARVKMSSVALLAPVFGHRFTAASPFPDDSPLFSVYQADIVMYGTDLVDFFIRELELPAVRAPHRRPWVPFWCDIATDKPGFEVDRHQRVVWNRRVDGGEFLPRTMADGQAITYRTEPR